MAVQQYTNAPALNPSSGISSGAATISVPSSAGYPASAPYRIRVSEGSVAEIMEVTGGAGTTTWNVSRAVEAVEGTQAAQTFTTAAVIELVLTAGNLLAAITDRQDFVWAPEPSGSDDTTTLQNLLASNRIVQLRAGTYLFSILNFSGISNCALRGWGNPYGLGTTLKFLSGTMTDDHQRNVYFFGGSNNRLESLIIDGNRSGYVLATALVGGGGVTTTGQTAWTVSSNGITDTDAFFARVDDEIVYVTAGGTTTSWTVVRAQHRTTAATHSVGATITYLTGNVSANSAIRNEFCDSVVIRNVRVTDARMSGMYFYHANNVILENCEIYDPYANGVLFQESCHYSQAKYNTVKRPGAMTNPQLIANAGQPTLSTSASGGTVAAGTYQLAYTWITAGGETLGHKASITTTGTTSTITATVPALPSGATGWNLYSSQAGGSTLTRQNGSPLTGTSSTITAPPSSGGAAFPTAAKVSTDSIKGLGSAFNSADLTTVHESQLYEGNLVDADTYIDGPNAPDFMLMEGFGSTRSRWVNNIVQGSLSQPSGSTFGISTGANADSVNILGNLVRRNIYFGIETSEDSHGSRIESNYIDDYYVGVTISTSQAGARSDGHTIVGNEIRNGRAWGASTSSAAIQISGECKRCDILGNNLIDMRAIGVNLLGTNVQDVIINGNYFVVKKQPANVMIEGIQIFTGTGHQITNNFFGPGPVKTASPAETASPARIRPINISGSAAIDRMLITGNRFNGAAPSGGTSADDGILMQNQVERTTINNNFFENFVLSAIRQVGTLGTAGNSIGPNTYGTGLPAQYLVGLNRLDIVVGFSDDHYRGLETVFHEFDDFMGALLTTGNIGKLGWNILGTGTITGQNSTAGRPGIIRLNSPATATTQCLIHLGAAGTHHPFGIASDFFDVTFMINITQLDTNTTFRCGIGNTQPAAASVANYTDMIGFERITTDTTNLFGVVKVGATNNRTAALITNFTAATWYKLRVRRINSTTIGFTVNNGTEVTTTVTAPTSAMQPFIQIATSAAAAKTLDVDAADLLLQSLAR